MNDALPDYFWKPGDDPDIDDDLMEQWLSAVVNRPGLTGPKLRATMEKLVSHMSGGKRVVVLRADIAAAQPAAAVERAFRDGLTYGTICDVTDQDEAWRTSQARARLQSYAEIEEARREIARGAHRTNHRFKL